MRHGTLTAEFKMIYLQIYTQLIYVSIIGVQPRNWKRLIWLCACQRSKSTFVMIVRKKSRHFQLPVTSTVAPPLILTFYCFQQHRILLNIICKISIELYFPTINSRIQEMQLFYDAWPFIVQTFFHFLISPGLQSDFHFLGDTPCKKE